MPPSNLLAVVCDDRPAVVATLNVLIGAAGFLPLTPTRDREELARVLTSAQPAVAVVALPLLGTAGVRGITALQRLAPDCAFVVLEAAGQLEAAALEAGARAVVPDGDLRPLRTLLLQLAHGPDGPPPLPRQPVVGRVSTNPVS